MIKLSARGEPVDFDGWRVGRATRDTSNLGADSLLVVDGSNGISIKSEALPLGILTTGDLESLGETNGVPLVHSFRNLDHVQEGHILLISSHPGGANTLFRPESTHNSLFVTERCNSNCLMCSQPPRDHVDDHLFDINRRVVELAPRDTEVLGLTGGEPTLFEDRLFGLLEQIKRRLPDTLVQMLTNGRRFAWKDYMRDFAAHSPQRLRVGIPLYSCVADEHDHVVQAKDAFDQTVVGIQRLYSVGISTEIRVVVHGLTVPRLRDIAEFIYRNFPFTEHVAFMGLETMGHTIKNFSQLWHDPVDYSEKLREAVVYLAMRGMNVSIYNHQLCVIDRSIWRFAAQSISDYKNVFLSECKACEAKPLCGGLFLSGASRHSRGIKAIRS